MFGSTRRIGADGMQQIVLDTQGIDDLTRRTDLILAGIRPERIHAIAVSLPRRHHSA
jgi:hypothetical protein